VAAAVKTKVGPICCYSGLRGSSGKRGSGSTLLPVTALIFIEVW